MLKKLQLEQLKKKRKQWKIFHITMGNIIPAL